MEFTTDQFVTLAWIFLWCILACSVPLALIGAIAFLNTKEGGAKSFTQMFDRANIVKVTTVILILCTTGFLCLAGKIDSSGAVAIISGVAGYVLGGLDKRSEKLLDGKAKGLGADSGQGG